jgi:hypothetical protein
MRAHEAAGSIPFGEPRHLFSLHALRDRAQLLQEEITIKTGEQTNRNLHVPSSPPFSCPRL